MGKTLQCETVEVTRATDHDCMEPYEWWVTADGKPLHQGLYYPLWLTRHEVPGRPFKRTRWTFLTTGHASEDEALAAGLAAARERGLL